LSDCRIIQMAVSHFDKGSFVECIGVCEVTVWRLPQSRQFRTPGRSFPPMSRSRRVEWRRLPHFGQVGPSGHVMDSRISRHRSSFEKARTIPWTDSAPSKSFIFNPVSSATRIWVRLGYKGGKK